MSDALKYILSHEQSFQSKARLASLYSDFRHLRTTNPDGYAANIAAWQGTLANAAREGLLLTPGGSTDLLAIETGEELLRALQSPEWGRPAAIGTVIKESLERKHIFPLHDFLTRTESIHHKSWNLTPWQVISWGLRQLGIGGGARGEDTLVVGCFVLLSNVEEAAQKISTRMSSLDRVDRILSKRLFKSQFAGSLSERHTLTDSDIEIVLTYLARDKGAVLYDGETIKVQSPGNHSTRITAEDTAIASLRTLIADQNAQISTLDIRIQDLSLAAKKAVMNKNKISALAALRSKKLAETMLARVSNNLSQLEEILNNVRQAADQVEMVRVMEASAGALRYLHKEVGGIEKVEAIVEELSDEIGKVQEVDTLINQLGQGNPDTSLEIDEELEAMAEAAERMRKVEELESRHNVEPSVVNDDTRPSLGQPLEASSESGRIAHDTNGQASAEAYQQEQGPGKNSRGEAVMEL